MEIVDVDLEVGGDIIKGEVDVGVVVGVDFVCLLWLKFISSCDREV